MSEAAAEHGTAPRVLVVEDEPRICELMASMLELEGFECRCVHTDRGAYETLQRERGFGCLIVDVNLGSGVTGYDVARFARRIDPGVAVIYVSGQTSMESLAANGVPGAVFLEKPFTVEELMDQVRQLTGDNDA